MTTTPDDNWDQALADLLAGDVAAAPETKLGSRENKSAGSDPVGSISVGAGTAGSPPPEDQGPGHDGRPALESATKAPQAAVLALGIGDKWLLAALLKGPKIAARAVVAEGLGLAVLDDPTEAAAISAAQTASGTLKGQHVLLLRRGESVDPAAGDIQAYLYVDGRELQRVSPGLVLAQSPQLLEDILIDPEAAKRGLAGAIDVNEFSPADAIAVIQRVGSASRRGRRGQRRRRESGEGGESA
ncbi:MAG: hypothetical protein LBG11_05615 [Bifidobacteriaceae bacterium]|jgi:hypothetical protein|nr:hypothetical protein [Bifidobacteriaceae bacterium]